VFPGHTRTPAQIIGELLTAHPEAASLQAEASHRRALSRTSAAKVARAFAGAQADRLGYEELRHLLDPRRRRTIHFGAGLVALVLLGGGLALLDLIELSGPLGPGSAAFPAVAAAAVWLTGACLAGLASREGRWPQVLLAAAAALLLGLLLGALYRLGSGDVLLGAAVSVLILILSAGAAVLMARMESASLLVARERWHRSRAAYAAAARIEQDDDEAAAVATESWLGLVRTYASAVAGDERLVRETMALAVALLEIGCPQPAVDSREQPGTGLRRGGGAADRHAGELG